MTAKAKIIQLIDKINTENQPRKNSELKIIHDFINDCGNYIEKVTAMEAAIATQRFRLEPADYRELIINLDRSRKLAHDALIAMVRVINRLCLAHEVTQVYEGPDERILIAEFAKEVVNNFFDERTL